jgi:YndJ-like protein
VVTVARAAHIARETSPRDGASTLVLLVPIGFLVIGVSWLTFDRLGIRPIGFPTLIVLLTAVHFHVAGFFLALAGLRVLRARPSATVVAAVGAVAVGAPLTAFAFLGVATIGWIGALLVAAGGIGIGLGQILSASHVALGAARAALLVGGATLLITMPLAAGYATGTTFGIPLLDVPAMAGIHGALNMLAFAIPTAFGWIAADRPTTGTPR